MDRDISRRDFLKDNLKLLAGLSTIPFTHCLSPIHKEIKTTSLNPGSIGNLLAPYTREASHYKKLANKKVECTLCPRKCRVGNRERGYCGVRENQEGVYYTLVYGNPCAIHVDPIEKKPFFHFLPSSRAFSLSTAGCNLNCRYCQNWEISQSRPENVPAISLFPKDAVSRAKKEKSLSIVGTYAEPIIFFEYMRDIAKEARAKGIRSAMVSAGYINPEPLEELCTHLDAIKIDLKAFDDDFYRKICVGELKPVLESLKVIKKSGVWLEILYLVVPTLNDDLSKIKEMCEWIKKNLGCDVPVHFSRFHPIYKLKNLPKTPVKTLENIYKTAKQVGLNYVYMGNVPGNPGENTFCPLCKKILIERIGYTLRKNKIINGECKNCRHKIPGIWK